MGVLPYAQCCWWKLEHGCSAEAITKGREDRGREEVTCEQIIPAPRPNRGRVIFNTLKAEVDADVCLLFPDVLMRYVESSASVLN